MWTGSENGADVINESTASDVADGRPMQDAGTSARDLCIDLRYCTMRANVASVHDRGAAVNRQSSPMISRSDAIHIVYPSSGAVSDANISPLHHHPCPPC